MQKMTLNITDELRRLHYENHDNCIVCNYAFEKNDCSHLGFGKNNEPLYVCDKCSYLLKETVIRYNYSPRPYEVPERSSSLWKYMDFVKYVSLLSKRALYFCRADYLGDDFEGAYGLASKKSNWDNQVLEFFKNAIANPPKGHKCIYNQHEIQSKAKSLLSDFEKGRTKQREFTFISCWHENEHESEAMWRLYSCYMKNVVAIRTNHGCLYESLGKNPSIDIGRVKYIDFSKQYAGNDPFWRKQKSFEHEREVRAIIIDRECNGKGKFISCDIDKLILEVRISPEAPKWFLDITNDLNKKYEFPIEVQNSLLKAKPFY